MTNYPNSNLPNDNSYYAAPEAATVTAPEPKKSSNLVLKLIPSILGIVLGIVIVFMGVQADFNNVKFKGYEGTTGSIDLYDPSHISYGGDAYTGIQNAASDAADNAAVAATNVYAANHILDNIDGNLIKAADTAFEAIATLITVFGVFTIGRYVVKAADIIVKEKA